MKRVFVRVFNFAMVLGLMASAAAAQNPDNSVWKIHVGTWKINLAKSKYNPATLAPKSTTVTNEPLRTGFKAVVYIIDSTGKAIHYEYSYRLDGKDVPIVGDPSRDMTSVRKIDDYTLEQVNKKAGKVMTTSRVVYARDGKSRTFTTTGTNPQGQAVNNVVVW